MSIIGSGVTDTRITASGPVNEAISCLDMDKSKKIGFILGDNTNFQDFTYVSLDTGRLDMDSGAAGLCGGAVFEAPGCTTSDCGLEYGVKNQKVLSSDGNDYIEHATIQGIFITGKDSPDDTSPCWEDDSNTKASFKCNSAPQSALYIPWSGNGGGCTNNVIIQDVTMLQSWADSVNIHGCANNILVQNNWFYQAGDDNIGLWSVPDEDGKGLKEIYIQDNDLSQVRNTGTDSNWGSCMAAYGSRDNIVFSGNTCRGRFKVDDVHAAVMFSPLFCGHYPFSEKCNNDEMFPDGSSVFVTGTTFLDNDEADIDSADHPSYKWKTCGARDNNFEYYKEFPNKLRTNNCPYGGMNGDPVYGCPDPSFIVQGCAHDNVEWKEDGDMGYGWYCADTPSNVKLSPNSYTADGGASYTQYMDACIRWQCSTGATFSDEGGFFVCNE